MVPPLISFLSGNVQKLPRFRHNTDSLRRRQAPAAVRSAGQAGVSPSRISIRSAGNGTGSTGSGGGPDLRAAAEGGRGSAWTGCCRLVNLYLRRP